MEVFFAEGKETKLPGLGSHCYSSRHRHDHRDGAGSSTTVSQALHSRAGPAAPADGQLARMPITLKDLTRNPMRITIADLQEERTRPWTL